MTWRANWLDQASLPTHSSSPVRAKVGCCKLCDLFGYQVMDCSDTRILFSSIMGQQVASWEEVYPSTEVQSVYFTAPADGVAVIVCACVCRCIYIYIYIYTYTFLIGTKLILCNLILYSIHYIFWYIMKFMQFMCTQIYIYIYAHTCKHAQTYLYRHSFTYITLKCLCRHIYIYIYINIQNQIYIYDVKCVWMCGRECIVFFPQ